MLSRKAAFALLMPRPAGAEQLCIRRPAPFPGRPSQLSCPPRPTTAIQRPGAGPGYQFKSAQLGPELRGSSESTQLLHSLATLNMCVAPTPTVCSQPQAGLFPILGSTRGYSLQQTALRKPWGVAPPQGKGGARRLGFQPPISILRGGRGD